MLLILSCTFRLGYDTSIVTSKVGRIMSYNFVYHTYYLLTGSAQKHGTGSTQERKMTTGSARHSKN